MNCLCKYNKTKQFRWVYAEILIAWLHLRIWKSQILKLIRPQQITIVVHICICANMHTYNSYFFFLPSDSTWINLCKLDYFTEYLLTSAYQDFGNEKKSPNVSCLYWHLNTNFQWFPPPSPNRPVDHTIGCTHKHSYLIAESTNKKEQKVQRVTHILWFTWCYSAC